MKRFVPWAAVLIWATLATLASAQQAKDPFQEAVALEREGQYQEAFLHYLLLPDREYAAVRLARPNPGRFLPILDTTAESIPHKRARLVEGDLRLALGQKDKALECYRDVARAYTDTRDYPVEPPVAANDGQPELREYTGPFELGPGSHRDNWLIRRFIALNALDDAAREFDRIWEIHRATVRAYVVEIPGPPDGKEGSLTKALISRSGFGGQALQFALDYAFFLQQRKETDKALTILLAPLALMDMDRNPNQPVPVQAVSEQKANEYPLEENRGAFAADSGWHRFGVSAGVSRKEFLRLLYGVFKTAGKEEALVAALQSQIDKGDNRVRRLLARVRQHQGKPTESLALDLDFIREAKFHALTSAWRRGLLFEEHGKVTEAIAEYEQALNLPYSPPDLPDPDEQEADQAMMRQVIPVHVDPASTAGRAQFQSDILARLNRLYASQGKTDKVLEISLRQFDHNESLIADLQSLEQVHQRFKAAGKEPIFLQWAAKRSTRVEAPEARANLCWIAGNSRGAADALAQPAGARNVYRLDEWKGRFRKLGNEPFRMLLTALVRANPGDARLKLELLDLEEKFEGPDVIESLESLLDADAGIAFVTGKGVYNRTQFRSYYDLAYRLMRLYERSNQPARLVALGLRIARREKPFSIPDPFGSQYRDSNSYEEDANACLALAIHHADATNLSALAESLRQYPWTGARAQVERRLSGGWKAPAGLKEFGWANLPKGVRLIASNENVLSLARDDRYVYAGHPWGIAVYDFEGNGITRVALGEQAEAIVAGSSQIWVGTPKGLFRIERDGWSVAHIWLHGDVPEASRNARSFPGPKAYVFDNSVYCLALDGDYLWIGLHRNVQRLNIPTLELRAYSFEELKIPSWAGYDRILPERDYVWACSPHSGLRRYDRKTDLWERIAWKNRDVSMIGPVGERFFVDVYIDDKLRHRPAILNRAKLDVTPIPIAGAAEASEQCLNSEVAYYGTFGGRLVFGTGGVAFGLDEESLQLRPIPEGWAREQDGISSPVPPGLRSGRPWFGADGVIRSVDDQTGRHKVFGQNFHTGRWVLVSLPDGTQVLGGRHERDSALEQYGWERPDGSGGLLFLRKDGRIERVSSRTYSDVISGDAVLAVVREDEAKRTWLCTDYGLAVLDDANRVVANFSRPDGLCANRVTSGLMVEGKLYFSTGWGDSGGGLAVWDPATSVFTAFFQADGLATDKIARIEPADPGIRIFYDLEYGRGRGFGWRLYPPDVFDPASPAWPSSRQPRLIDRDDQGNTERSKLRPLHGGIVSFLDGLAIIETPVGTRKYTGGEHGLLIVEGDGPVSLSIDTLAVEVTTDPAVALKEEASRLRIQVQSPADLARYRGSNNPYIREAALAGCAGRIADNHDGDFIPELVTMSDDPHPPVRLLAVKTLGELGSLEGLPAVEKALNDPDRTVRQAAAVSSARLGRLPALRFLEEILEEAGRNAYQKEDLYLALAPLATPEVLALFLQYPIPVDNYEPRVKIFKLLGNSLVKHPSAVQVLLRAHNTSELNSTNFSPVSFASEVLRHAGKDPKILALLYEALKSDDRIVRSNAARGCGAIGDPAAVPHLLEALGLESGLARASIVWALGELAAKEALPKLTQLYGEARNDEQRRRGAGYRAAQQTASVRSQYDSIGSLDALKSDWDEIRASAAPEPLRPDLDEELFTAKHVLDAIRKIGPSVAQDFYRKLAAEKNADARREAAIHLTDVLILGNLLGDSQSMVCIEAAVSLHLLGDKRGSARLLAGLSSGERGEKGLTVRALSRVKDAAALAFAQSGLKLIADDVSADRFLREEARKLLGTTP